MTTLSGLPRADWIRMLKGVMQQLIHWLAQRTAGRMLLHLVCIGRGGRREFHWAGVRRELACLHETLSSTITAWTRAPRKTKPFDLS